MSEHTLSKAPVKRRRYSKDFKDRIIAACDQPGASVAGIALANGLNANLVHRWRRQPKPVIAQPCEKAEFLPIAMPPVALSSDPVVIFDVASLKVHWPLAHIDRAIVWLRALQS
jgi:hypothetical protein